MQRIPLTIHQVFERLEAYLHATCGDTCSVRGLKVMEAGHAGLTFGFDLVTAGVVAPRGLVLKLAPQGVKRSGNTDVYRQAPLLRALHASGLAVPDVPFASDTEAAFGAPFIMMERLGGEPFFVWEPNAAFDLSDGAVTALWEQTINAMVDLHRFDWKLHLMQWEAPRALSEELGRWDAVLVKSPEPTWITNGRKTHDRLLATLPKNTPVGLVHGDCQPGNALFYDARMTGLIDWELASIGACWLDVGWMMMLADPASWCDQWRPHCPLSPGEIADRYVLAMNEPDSTRDTLRWFQAFAGYRLGAIACLNVHLHRSGRRHDVIWEHFAQVIPQLFARSLELVAQEPLTSGLSR